MQKICNDPDDIVSEFLQGYLKAHENLLIPTANERVIKARTAKNGKVGVVTGGGSGHEPAFLGYLGYGMLDAVAVGEIFSSPTAAAFLEAFRAADNGAGVACLYGNYSGDNMNVKLAVKMAQKEGLTVRTVVANDDAASATPEQREKRRGVAGEILMWKAAGAKACAGACLDEVITAARHAIDNTRSVGIGLSPCTLPAARQPNFEIRDGTMEIGIGHHGEPGIRVSPLEDAAGIARQMTEIILPDLPFRAGDEVAVLLSGLGATPLMEQYLLFHQVETLLVQKHITVYKSYVGNFFTSLQMGGVSLTLMRLDAELKKLIDAEADTAEFKQRSCG